MKISVRSNIKEFRKELSKSEKKQLPFAIALALNATKYAVEDAARTSLLRKIDKGPTPFTLKAFSQTSDTRATKKRQVAVVQIKPIQAAYLQHTFYGGRTNKGKYVPGKHYRLNQYGNFPRGKTKSLSKEARKAGERKYFIGKPKGHDNLPEKGIYQRLPSNPKSKKILLIGFVPEQRDYKSGIVNFNKIAEKTAGNELRKNLVAAIEYAMTNDSRAGAYLRLKNKP